MKQILKMLHFKLSVAVVIALASCTMPTSQKSMGDNQAETAKSDSVPVATTSFSIDGDTLKWGHHAYVMTGDMGDEYVEGAVGQVSFTNVPSDFTEFKTVYEKFLGTTPYGTAAMLPMAFELYARQKNVGDSCLQLLCSDLCYKEVLRELPRKLNASEQSPASDPYVQRCLPAAVLQGATKENGYNPTEPYTVTMTIGMKRTYREGSEVLQAYTYQLDIVADGNAWNTPHRTVRLQRGWSDLLYKVNTCGSLYFNIYAPRKPWQGLK